MYNRTEHNAHLRGHPRIYAIPAASVQTDATLQAVLGRTKIVSTVFFSRIKARTSKVEAFVCFKNKKHRELT